MNHTLKKCLLIIAIGVVGVINADDDSTTPRQYFGHNFFQQRDSTSDTARELMFVTEYLVPCDSDCLNGFATLVPQYGQSFDRDELGRYFFYNGTNTMTFSGNSVPGVANTGVDVFSRYFFLNDNFTGQITALPKIQIFNLDFRLRLNLDNWLCGLYFDIHGPVTWTRWGMHLKETPGNEGTTIGINVFGNAAAAASPVTSIIQAFNGQTTGGTTFPAIKSALEYGRINCTSSSSDSDSSSSCNKPKTRLAGIEMALGWNFWCNECYHLGLDVRAIAPTGNRPNAHYLFEPIAGNGHHWEVGGGVSGHYEFWNNGCDSSFSAWVQGNVYHVFSTRQRRIFDLVLTSTTVTVPTATTDTNVCVGQNVGSNRLTIKQFDPNTGLSLNTVLFGPNVLALRCKVSNAVHADVSLMFDYQRCGFNFDAGYNFWVVTRDKIKSSSIDTIPANTYAVQGFTNSGTSNTGSTAQINGAGGTPDATNTFISNSSLDICSAQHPTAMSHKFFAGASYAWMHCDYTPFVGLFGEVEFSGRHNSAMDFWSIGVKGGFAFS